MDMDMELAWDEITDASSVVVAIVGTGINYLQEDFFSNIWSGLGYDFVDGENDPMDLNGHGTHVVGTIGSAGNNYKGETGISWKVQLMAIRVVDAAGYSTTANTASGIYCAVDNEANIINLSIGGNSYEWVLYNAIDYARNNGVLVVSTAGNDANNN